MERVLAALDDQGVEEADVQTTGLQMYPEYDYPSYGPPVLTGYRVTQRARVVVRELAQGGEAVSTAVETGGNGVRVTDIRLGVSDPEAALGRARDAAVEAATAKAEQYAAATGQTLGEVLGAAGGRGRHGPRPQPVLSLQARGPRRAGRAARSGRAGTTSTSRSRWCGPSNRRSAGTADNLARHGDDERPQERHGAEPRRPALAGHVVPAPQARQGRRGRPHQAARTSRATRRSTRPSTPT